MYRVKCSWERWEDFVWCITEMLSCLLIFPNWPKPGACHYTGKQQTIIHLANSTPITNDWLLYCRISYTCCLSLQSQFSNIKSLQKPRRLPRPFSITLPGRLMCAGEIGVKHCVNMKGEGWNEPLVMPWKRKDPSNQCIPPAPDIPQCSLRCRGKCSTEPLAKDTPALEQAALSKHLLPSGSDPVSVRCCHHEDRKAPSWHQMMSSAGEEGNIQAQGCASATNLLKDLPRANPGISALWVIRLPTVTFSSSALYPWVTTYS